MFLLFLVLLLLIFPTTFNRVLERAGFTEGNFMGLTWKQKALQSKQVADSSQSLAEAATRQMEEMQNHLDSISKKLDAVAQTTNNPNVNRITADIDSSKTKFMLNRVFLNKGVSSQRTKLNTIFKDR